MQKLTLSFISLVAIAVLTVSGCAQVQEVLAPAQPERKQTAAADAATVYDPAGGAVGNQAFFARIAQEYAASDVELNGETMVNAFAAAGFNKEDMQVSFDKTQINLDTDAMFLAVRFEQECLIAQVGRAKRDYVTNLAPALGADKTKCLIGKTREIDW